jgi:hypothetical protein
MVRKGGLEPPQTEVHKILSLNNLCLLRFAEVSGDRLSRPLRRVRCQVSQGGSGEIRGSPMSLAHLLAHL